MSTLRTLKQGKGKPGFFGTPVFPIPSFGAVLSRTVTPTWQS